MGVKAYAALTQHPIQPLRLPKDLQAEIPRPLRLKRSVYPRELPADVVDEIWKRFHSALAPLRTAGKLAYVLFQMPKWFVPNGEAHRYLESLPARLSDAPIALEFRQAGWLTDDRRARTLDFVARNGLVYVSVDEPQGTRASVPPVAAATSDAIAVVRFHGRKKETWDKPGASTIERFGYLYDRRELREWIPRLRALSAKTHRVHVLMNNCYRDYAVQNAKDLAAMLAAD
jgi:uncharacterized protein YecE (DUF72 family)